MRCFEAHPDADVVMESCFWYAFAADERAKSLFMNMPSHEELYDRFVKGLESKHRGAFAAVRAVDKLLLTRTMSKSWTERLSNLALAILCC